LNGKNEYKQIYHFILYQKWTGEWVTTMNMFY
jgi:hypothetical protein